MRASRLFARTLREDPAEAEIVSHKLLIRGAYVRKVMAGIYTTLPLGLRVMRKVEEIIREEMDGADAQEVRMPIAIPSEAWRQTGRFEAYGDLLFKMKDRHGREMILGPTQEEVVTPLVAGELPSYKDLPVNLYQVEWKYRDEFRPRFGLLRGREFLMKDAYSFDRDDDGMRESYRVMYEAYERIFDRCGLKYVVVEADPGQIGGGINHEYMAVAEVGEDLYVGCSQCDYLADVEAATPRAPEPVATDDLRPVAEVATPGKAAIEDVAGFLGVAANATLKSMMFKAGDQALMVLVPGDREVNEEKLARLYFPTVVERFEDADFIAHGLVKGYVGPSGVPQKVTVLADPSVRAGRDWVAGANREGFHLTGVNLDRDFSVARWEELVQLRDGDLCPVDGGDLHIGRSIVVGHIYQLGTKYSKPLEATFLDEDGTQKNYVMGCYGIGISRIMAAAAEQFHDDAGLTWPKAIAPFEVVVIMANQDDPATTAEAERIYAQLKEAGVDVLLDDRDERAGVKFADADLIGYPVQVVVGKRGIEAGEFDIKQRQTGERTKAPVAGAVEAAIELLSRSR